MDEKFTEITEIIEGGYGIVIEPRKRHKPLRISHSLSLKQKSLQT